MIIYATTRQRGKCSFDCNDLDFAHVFVFIAREPARIFAALFPRGIPAFRESSVSRDRRSLSWEYLFPDVSLKAGVRFDLGGAL